MIMTPEAIIKDISQLVSLPEAVVRANELLNSPSSSTAEIGEVISHDPALSAGLLKLVNSAFYHFPNKIETISRAITLIGHDELRSLIIAAITTETFHDLSSESIDMNAFWQRSVYCGLVARKLSPLLRVGSAEAMFLTGLLHEVGRLILYARLAKQAQLVIAEAEASKRSLSEIEEEVLGFTSARLGSALLESWKLPRSLWEPVRYQDTPQKAPDFRDEATVLNVACQITECVEPELKSGQPLQLDTLPEVEIDNKKIAREQLQLLIDETNMECFDVLAIVNPDALIIY